MTEGSTTGFSHLRALFRACTEASGDRRANLLEETRRRDSALAAQLEALLEADAESVDRTWLDSGAGRGGANAHAGEVGRRIRGYRIERVIGIGGMGTVFRAVRASDRFETVVAIKMLLPSIDTAEARRRFKVEQEALAILDHPSIARLYDGGVTADERLFIVMEHVEGWPIDVYCMLRDPSLEQRLDLFEQICGAIRYAHRHLIVHRDLKPSNVLVTAEGVPKIVDFGVAKLLCRPADPAMTVYRPPLTPEYAAPEQIRGETITTATDVYALGVLLFELLTGRHPWRGRFANVEALERAVCNQPMPRPSSFHCDHARRRGDTDDSTRWRPASPPFQARRLRGDLDNVVLRATAKDTHFRYQSVGALLDDIRRFRTGLPVRASSNSYGYRLLKFVGRHRAAVAVTVLLTVLLAGAMGVAVVQSRRAAYQRVQAMAQRDHAVLEQARAERLAEYMIEVLTQSEPERALASNTSFSMLSTWAGQEAVVRFADDPATAARILTALARIARRRGDYGAAERTLARAGWVIHEAPGVPTSEEWAYLIQLAKVRRAQGMWSDAERLLTCAMRLQLRAVGGNSVAVANTRHELALTLSGTGSYDPALQSIRSAREVQERTFGIRSWEALASLTVEGLVLLQMQHVDEAARVLRRSATLERGIIPERHPNRLRTLEGLALAESRDDCPMEVAGELGRIVEMRCAVQGENHADTLRSRIRLAVALYRAGDVPRALEILGEVHRAAAARYGPEAFVTLIACLRRAQVLAQDGRRPEARAEYDRVIGVGVNSLDMQGFVLAEAIDGMARLVFDEPSVEKLRGSCQGACASLVSRVDDERFSEVTRSLVTFGALAESQGSRAEADLFFIRACQCMSRRGLSNDTLVREVHAQRGLGSASGKPPNSADPLAAQSAEPARTSP